MCVSFAPWIINTNFKGALYPISVTLIFVFWKVRSHQGVFCLFVFYSHPHQRILSRKVKRIKSGLEFSVLTTFRMQQFQVLVANFDQQSSTWGYAYLWGT